MDDLDILRKMFADVDVEKQKVVQENARTGGKHEFSMGTYLADRGYKNIQDVGRFQNSYGNRADLEKTFMPMAERMPTVAEAESPFNEFKGSMQGMAQQATLNTDRTKTAMGMGPQEYHANLKKNAYNALYQRGEITSSMEDADTELFGLNREKIRAEMVEIMAQSKEATLPGGKLTLDPNRWKSEVPGQDRLEALGMGDLTAGFAGSKSTVDQFFQRGLEVKAAGGDPSGNSSQVMKDYNATQTKMLDQAVRSEKQMTVLIEAVKANRPPPGPPPGPAPAAVQVARPGGANAGLAR